MSRRRSTRKCRASCVLLAAICAVGAGAVAATAQDAPQLVDRVLAIVDEEAILQSDLDREVQLFRMNQEYAEQPVSPDTPELRREMLDRLVEAKLIIAAAKAAGLAGFLQSDGPFTVFAPTDEAFAKLPEETLEALVADPDALREILLYHVVPGNVTSDQVVKLDRATMSASVEGRAPYLDADLALAAGIINIPYITGI